MEGVSCKRSRCLKEYCECHSGGIKCGAMCECVECVNRDENEPMEQEVRSLRGHLVERTY